MTEGDGWDRCEKDLRRCIGMGGNNKLILHAFIYAETGIFTLACMYGTLYLEVGCKIKYSFIWDV